MNKVAKLKAIFKSLKMEILPGVYDEQSAYEAEQDGFKGVWVSVAEQVHSGMNISDWINTIEKVGSLSRKLSIPCLVDIGKGFGDLHNTVAHLRRVGIVGVCLEDGLEPGEPWSLAAVNESCERVRAAKEVAGKDIFLVARCGALANGRGMQETLDRCYALQNAGADAVLLHSQKAHGLDIAEFMYRWRSTVPVAIISSQYTSVPTQVFDNAGVAVAIRATRGLVTTQTDPDKSGWLHVETRLEGNFEQDTVLLHLVREEAENRYQPG